jgi:hypothetical protein
VEHAGYEPLVGEPRTRDAQAELKYPRLGECEIRRSYPKGDQWSDHARKEHDKG